MGDRIIDDNAAMDEIEEYMVWLLPSVKKLP